jgi:hypothetical protein
MFYTIYESMFILVFDISFRNQRSQPAGTAYIEKTACSLNQGVQSFLSDPMSWLPMRPLPLLPSSCFEAYV